MSISGAAPPILPSPTVDSANGAESSCVKCSTPEGFPCSVPAPRNLAPWGTISASQSNEPVTSGSPVPASLAVALTRALRTRCGASSAAANVTSICAADPFASSLPSGLAITRLPASGQNRPLHCATASNLGSPPSTSAACAEAANGREQPRAHDHVLPVAACVELARQDRLMSDAALRTDHRCPPGVAQRFS